MKKKERRVLIGFHWDLNPGYSTWLSVYLSYSYTCLILWFTIASPTNSNRSAINGTYYSWLIFIFRRELTWGLYGRYTYVSVTTLMTIFKHLVRWNKDFYSLIERRTSTKIILVNNRCGNTWRGDFKKWPSRIFIFLDWMLKFHFYNYCSLQLAKWVVKISF